VFTVAGLAAVADVSPAVLNVELGRLVSRGLIRRRVPGRYGLPDGVTAFELVAAIDADAYVTGAYALAQHGFITRVPHEIDCFTRRRHNRPRRRQTPLGTIVFICVGSRVHAPPAGRGLAPPGQAPCDLVFVHRRRGLDPRTLCTFRNLGRLRVSPVVVDRYPATVQRGVAAVLSGNPSIEAR
jgi:hypothetical protein